MLHMDKKHAEDTANKRRIMLAFKSTGHKPMKGDGLTELAAVEMIGMEKTGNNFHTFIDPQVSDEKMQECRRDFEHCKQLKNGKALAPTLQAMALAPEFDDHEKELLMREGVAEYMMRNMQNSPTFAEIEDELMDYIFEEPNTVIIAHDLPLLNAFLKANMKPENWAQLSPMLEKSKMVKEWQYDEEGNSEQVSKEIMVAQTRHSMMKKAHNLRPVGLFPAPAKGKSWMEGLKLDDICTEFKVDVTERTHYSAMQDADLLADAVVNRKALKEKNLELFSGEMKGTKKSKSYPTEQEMEMDSDTEEDNSMRMSR